MNRTLYFAISLLALFTLVGSTCENPCGNEQEYVVVEFFNSNDSSQIFFPDVPYDRVTESKSGAEMPQEEYFASDRDYYLQYVYPGAYLLFFNPNETQLEFVFSGAALTDTLQLSYGSEVVYQEEDCDGVVFRFDEFKVEESSFNNFEFIPSEENQNIYEYEAARIRVWL